MPDIYGWVHGIFFGPGQVSYDDDEHSMAPTHLDGMIALKNERRKASEVIPHQEQELGEPHPWAVSAAPQCSQGQQRGNLSDPTPENSPTDQGYHPRGCSTAAALDS